MMQNSFIYFSRTYTMCFDPIHPHRPLLSHLPLLFISFHPAGCPFMLGEGDSTGFIRIPQGSLWEEGLLTEARKLPAPENIKCFSFHDNHYLPRNPLACMQCGLQFHSAVHTPPYPMIGCWPNSWVSNCSCCEFESISFVTPERHHPQHPASSSGSSSLSIILYPTSFLGPCSEWDACTI